MKILLAQTLLYLPTYGGANKGNRFLLEALAAKGVSCRVVAPATGIGGPQNGDELLQMLSRRSIPSSVSDQICRFCLYGVDAVLALEPGHLRAELRSQIHEFDPDWILVASEDPAHSLLDVAINEKPERVIYVSQTTSMLPFGPSSMFPGAWATDLIRRAAGIICLSRYLQTYIKNWGGMDAAVVRMPIYGNGPYPVMGNFASGHVLLINPCDYKGIKIFAQLARKFPELSFAAIPSWGTTAKDKSALNSLRNVELLHACDETDQLLKNTRILLAPSLWDEAFGHVVVEAMLRGIPVLASNSGGLPEAKLGVDYVLPVTGIQKYENGIDECSLPVAVFPEQNIEPWAEALEEVLSSQTKYEKLALYSRWAALAFASSITTEPLERYLHELRPRSLKQEKFGPVTPQLSSHPPAVGNGISPARQALLALRLRRKQEDSADVLAQEVAASVN